jgi:hypothetical protein
VQHGSSILSRRASVDKPVRRFTMVVLSPVRQVIFLFLNVRILFIKQLLGWRFWGGWMEEKRKKTNC